MNSLRLSNELLIQHLKQQFGRRKGNQLLMISSQTPFNKNNDRYYSTSFSFFSSSQQAGLQSSTPTPTSSNGKSSRTSPSGGSASSSSIGNSSDPSRMSAHSNVSMPKVREMPISQLNQIEEIESKREGDQISALNGQQVQLDGEEVGLIEKFETDQEHLLTFKDVKLADVLASKEKFGTSIHAVNENDNISAAMELISLYGIGAVLVRSSSENGKIVGIISTRDYIRKIQEEGVHPTQTPIKKFMTESPIFAYSDDTAIQCLALMTKHNFRHLPVREKQSQKTIGLVSIGDLVRIMLKQYKESNIFLREFIDGRY